MTWTAGDLIRKLRTVFGWDLEELADLAKVDLNTISRIERGVTKKPELETLVKIASVAGWTADQFLAAIPKTPLEVSTVALRDARAVKQTAAVIQVQRREPIGYKSKAKRKR